MGKIAHKVSLSELGKPASCVVAVVSLTTTRCKTYPPPLKPRGLSQERPFLFLDSILAPDNYPLNRILHFTVIPAIAGITVKFVVGWFDMEHYNRQLGPVAQKILLLLAGGFSLALSGNPQRYFRVLGQVSKEWKKINERSLRIAIKNLYASQLIDIQENKNGTVTIDINDSGKKRALTYDLEAITLIKPKKWDGLWRVVIFDIPESQKKGRNALSAKLKQVGFYPLQKSVFIHPYECRDEITFVAEIFNVKSHVRFLIVKETDVDLHLRNIFEKQLI